MCVNSFLLIGWLYLVQGIPYGIQDKFIPLHLHLQNLTFTNVSLMKGLLFPWICKGLWAPFIQVYFGPYFWLVFSTAGLSMISLLGSFTSAGDVYGIAVVLFCLNLFSAVQDIVVDGFALNALRAKQLGIGNSLQVVMYKFGSLFGGAGLIYVSSYTSWRTCYILLGGCYLVTVFIIVLRRKSFSNWTDENVPPTNDKLSPLIERNELTSEQQEYVTNRKDSDNVGASKNSVVMEISDRSKVLRIVQDVFKTQSILELSLYVALYKMGERGAINNFPLYLLDKGVSTSQLAFWNGIVCQCLSILGSAVGGWKLSSTNKRESSNKVLRVYILHRSLAILLFYFIIQFWHTDASDSGSGFAFYYLSMFSLMYLNFTSGVISTATFTVMMEQSRTLSKDSQATHYSCLSSIEVGGKLSFATFAGVLIDVFNIKRAFFLFFILSLLPYFIVRRVKSRVGDPR